MRSICSISQSVFSMQHMQVKLLIFIKELNQFFCSTSTGVSNSIFLLHLTGWVHITLPLYWSALMSVCFNSCLIKYRSSCLNIKFFNSVLMLAFLWKFFYMPGLYCQHARVIFAVIFATFVHKQLLNEWTSSLKLLKSLKYSITLEWIRTSSPSFSSLTSISPV